ncbi:MAG TPA: hypothetical protein VKZ68_01425 [Ohtaekwangia sp.]|nr:hypothetical protein [Ohtaekwangia sp.]
MSLLALIMFAQSAFAQQPALQYFRPQDKTGINVFETSKVDSVEYEGIKVRLGGGFAMQFQSISQSNAENNLAKLGSDFNLPTANLNIDVQLYDGVRLHMRNFFSSRHHNEAWVKGGHMQIDKLDFIKPGFMENIMQYTTIRVGLDEFNYGDNHFRRSDNAQALYNPFVENFIMDGYATEAFGEVTFQNRGFIVVLGVTNGKLNQNVVKVDNADNKPSFFGKLGYDKQVSDDLRVRLTGSWYRNHGTTSGTWLYGGDRAGARYYHVLRTVPDPNNANTVTYTDFDGRYNARFTKLTAIQVNPFLKYKGLEFYGVYELADGAEDIVQGGNVVAKAGSFTQLAGELVYRFGGQENFFVGGRYNTVSGKTRDDMTDTMDISRLQLGAGWFLTRNVLMKAEYVKQEYKGAWTGRFNGAEFDGIVIEAVIGF